MIRGRNEDLWSVVRTQSVDGIVDSIQQRIIKVEGWIWNSAESFNARAIVQVRQIELHLDSLNGTKIVVTSLQPETQNWTVKCTVSGATGKHDLLFKARGNGLLLVNRKFNPVKVGIGSAVRNSWNAFAIVSNMEDYCSRYKARLLTSGISKPHYLICRGRLVVQVWGCRG